MIFFRNIRDPKSPNSTNLTNDFNVSFVIFDEKCKKIVNYKAVNLIKYIKI